MMFRVFPPGYPTAHIGGWLLGSPSTRLISVANNGVLTATTQARNRLKDLPFRALSCPDGGVGKRIPAPGRPPRMDGAVRESDGRPSLTLIQGGRED